MITSLLLRFFKRKNSSGQRWQIVIWAETRTLALCSHSYLTGKICFVHCTLLLYGLGSLSYHVMFYLQWWLWCYYGWDSWELLKTLLPWPNAAQDGINSYQSQICIEFRIYHAPTVQIKVEPKARAWCVDLVHSPLHLLGEFINFLLCKYIVHTVDQTTLQVKCLDVLGVSDYLTQYVYRTQHMSLQGSIWLFITYF